MDKFLIFFKDGILQFNTYQVLIYLVICTHITSASITIFLHRMQAHRSIVLHPIISHFFRMWLWLTTGIITKEWVAVHRKHHAKCEKIGDPHSPAIFGIRKVLFRGSELYQSEAIVANTIKKYGHGTPNDWIETHIYARYNKYGMGIMLLIDLILFGSLGIAIWAIKIAWMPFWTAGVINGLGHYYGYRNFACPDLSRNIFPIGIIVCGEELHNNHHAYSASAKFSRKWYELDIGWAYIYVLSLARMAQIKKNVSPLRKMRETSIIDSTTLNAIITHRYEILFKYHKLINDELNVMSKTELNTQVKLTNLKKLISTNQFDLKQDLCNLENSRIHVILVMYSQLKALWEKNNSSDEQLLLQLKEWYKTAQTSNISSLEKFSSNLAHYST